MDAREIRELTEILTRAASAARQNPETARQLRDVIAESGFFDVFETNGTLDILDLLDVGGEAALRGRLKELSLAQLREIITTHQLDAEKMTAKWRSTTKLLDYIITRANQRLAEEQAVTTAQPSALVASWML